MRNGWFRKSWAFAWRKTPPVGWMPPGGDGLRYQIKCRWERTDFPTPQSRELGVIRSLEKNQFDFLIAVIFDSHFQVRAAYQIPHEIIPRYAVYRRHVNGHILLADGPILRDPATKDITHLLR